jgi:hypothetical protein
MLKVNYLGAIPIAIGTRGIERKFKFDFDACLPTKAGPPEERAGKRRNTCGRQV